VVEPGRLIMRSDNGSYSDIVLDYNNQALMDKVKIIGRAVWWCHDEKV
jgi:phage repressor protein C with HTH and peptisase S24 domain